MASPTDTTQGPRLRPRWRSWLRSLVEAQFLPCCVLGVALLDPHHGRDWAVPIWVYFVVFPALPAIEIWREARRNPPLLRFWERDNRNALVIRELKTGKVLLQSLDGTLTQEELLATPLAGACLSNLNLRWVVLDGKDLRGADLSYTQLEGAKLSDAILIGANLEGANLGNASLAGSDLRRARLASANLLDSDLRCADLRGADFVGQSTTLVLWDSQLGGAKFAGAIYDSATRWPIGFDYAGRGCVLAPDDAIRLPIPSIADTPGAEQLPLPANSAPTGGQQEAATEKRTHSSESQTSPFPPP